MSYVRVLPPKFTHASLDLAGPATQLDTVVEAVEEGPGGNAITIAAAADNDALTKASLDLDTVTGDIDTVIEAAVGGADGNDITVTIVGDSGAAEGVTIDEVGSAVTIHFETAVSTVADLEAAITADATLIAVKTAGTGATVLDSATDECEDESLAGGLDSEGVTFAVVGNAITAHFATGESTVEDFETALAADAAVSALIRVKTAGTAAAVLAVADDDFSATALTGGGSSTVAAPDVDDEEAGVPLPSMTDKAVLLVNSVAGSGTMTATPTVYGFHPELRRWFLVYASSAIAETGTDQIYSHTPLTGLFPYSRIAIKLAVGGTATEVEAGLHCMPAAAQSA